MSIENSINNLVEQQNKLMLMFDSNEQRWNDAVRTTIESFKEDFLDLTTKGFLKHLYIDSKNGLDTNVGSSELPFRSLKAAIDSVPFGGHAEIHLAAGQNFLVDSPIEINYKTINLFSSNNNEATVKFTYSKVLNNTEYRWEVNGFKLGYSANLSFNSVNIETPQVSISDRSDPTVPNGVNPLNAIIVPTNSNAFIYFRDSYLLLNSFNLISQSGINMTNVYFSNSIIRKVIVNQNNSFLLYLQTGFMNLLFDTSSCQILDNRNLTRDLIKINDEANVKLLMNGV